MSKEFAEKEAVYQKKVDELQAELKSIPKKPKANPKRPWQVLMS